LKSYVKIYGPPLLKAMRALEQIGIGMPEVCIMDTLIQASPSSFKTAEGVKSYFANLGEVPKERCANVISKSGVKLEGHDLVFEWLKAPKVEQVNALIEKIDEALKPLGVEYTISTK